MMFDMSNEELAAAIADVLSATHVENVDVWFHPDDVVEMSVAQFGEWLVATIDRFDKAQVTA